MNERFLKVQYRLVCRWIWIQVESNILQRRCTHGIRAVAMVSGSRTPLYDR